MAIDMPSESIDEAQLSPLVLVTGANGFIASHVVAQLLDAGYQVLGTVRSAQKAHDTVKIHHGHQNLKIIIVSDITNKDDYIATIDAASNSNLSAIIHLAAPFSYAVTDFEKDLLVPAVQGTESILDVAQHYHVKTVVHTNSFACIYDAAAGPAPEKTYTAADWSPLTYDDGVTATNPPSAYRAAKSVAEKAAWEYMKKNQGQVSFNLVSLCPAMVLGPFLPKAEPSSIDSLNESNKLVWDVVKQGSHGQIPPTKAPVWVDVRDVAKAHVKALTCGGLAGQRLLLAAGVYCNQEIADAAREACPTMISMIPKGQPGKREADSHFKVNSHREAKLLDMQWTSLQDSLKDLLPQLFDIASRTGQ